MLRLVVKKEEEQKREENRPRMGSPAVIRLQKDLADLDLPSMCTMEHPNPDDLKNFRIIVRPDSGFYSNGKFLFTFIVTEEYPHEAPKVKCQNKIYHPNIDPDGNVCLNILRQEWKPVLTINAVIHGLIFLFMEPNPEDPLNKDAAAVLRKDKRQFELNVKRTMKGMPLDGINYDYVL